MKSVFLLTLILVSIFSFSQSFSEEEQKLYDMVMAYRKTKGLPAIPFSKSLTKVAHMHVNDMVKNNPVKGECNLHSWSNKGEWTPCCYTDDHAEAANMWNKPRELTNYKGNGYEIAHSYSSETNAEEALASWQSSGPHDDVILNRDIWKKHPWKAIGIGIRGSYAVIWFGDNPDE